MVRNLPIIGLFCSDSQTFGLISRRTKIYFFIFSLGLAETLRGRRRLQRGAPQAQHPQASADGGAAIDNVDDVVVVFGVDLHFEGLAESTPAEKDQVPKY